MRLRQAVTAYGRSDRPFHCRGTRGTQAQAALSRGACARAYRRDRAGERGAQHLHSHYARARAGSCKGERCALAQRRGAAARRHSARHQGSVRHQGRTHHGLLARSRRLHADLRVNGDGQSVERRRGHARQAQQRRVRHGLVQRDEPLRAGGQSLAPYGIERQARAGRIVGRLVSRGRGTALHGRHRHRYRRLDPPAGSGHWHRRHQADLWPLLALGHRRLRLVARSGGADRAHRARRGDSAESHGEPRPEGHDERRCAGAGLRGCGDFSA